MALNVQLPDVLRRLARVIKTTDDTTFVDRVVSVGTLVLVALLIAPLVHSVLPILPEFLVTPLTAGLLHAVVETLA